MKNEKNLGGFSYSKSIANFEAFRWNISSSTNSKIGRSGPCGENKLLPNLETDAKKFFFFTKLDF